METNIAHLYHFVFGYLKKLVKNIPNNLLYEKQWEGYNSAGWILGHICVECEDVFNHFGLDYTKKEEWTRMFRNTKGVISKNNNLPTKEELLKETEIRFNLLLELYKNLSQEQKSAKHPSQLIQNALPDIDSWVAHHLTTHIAVHCGNLVVWKKILGLKIDGY